VSYSLWSRGRLLGTSDVVPVHVTSSLWVGDLHPTEVGETLLPTADARDLELRGPDGEPVATSTIEVQDIDALLARGAPSDRADDAEWEHALDASQPPAPADLDFDPTRASLDEPELDEPELASYDEAESFEPRDLPRFQLLVRVRGAADAA
jgi:hypothetical protein